MTNNSEIDKFVSCTRKNGYGWALDATRQAYHLSESRSIEFEPYRCRYCGMWHIGRIKDRSRYSYNYSDVLYNNESPFHL